VFGPGNWGGGNNNGNIIAAFDIRFVKDDVTVQPGGMLTIRIPIKSYDPTHPNTPSPNANWNVFYLEHDNGNVTNATDMNARVVLIDGTWHCEFETDHFSVYALAEVEDEAPPTEKTFWQRLIDFFMMIIQWFKTLSGLS